MKRLLLLLLLLISAFLHAQIPNSGFENWSPNQACLRPLGWNSVYSEFDSSGTYCPVQRSDDHFPEGVGQYSLRISNDTAIWHSGTEPASWLGWGILFSSHFNDRPLFPVEGRPKSLCGYYRFLPENGDTLNLRAFLYNNGQEIAMAHFRSDQPAPEWTPFRVYFNDTTYAQADSGRITLSSANEPKDGSLGPLGNSVLWIDNISFDELVTAMKEQISQNGKVEVFQEVGSCQLVLKRDNKQTTGKAEIQILDLQGRLEQESTWNSGETEYRIKNPDNSNPHFIRYKKGKFQLTKLIPPMR